MERYIDSVVRSIGENKIAGVASVYYNGNSKTQYEVMPGVVERIAPGAFDQVLRSNPDVIGSWEHAAQGGKILARSGAGLELWSEADGLHFSIELNPQLSYARDLKALVDSSVIRGCSFAAQIGYKQWNQEGSSYTIQRFSALHDVCVTAMPCYKSTSVRTMDSEDINQLERERAAWLETYKRLEKAKGLIKK